MLIKNNKKKISLFLTVLICIMLIASNVSINADAAVIDMYATSQSDNTLSIPKSVEPVKASDLPAVYSSVDKNVITPVKEQMADDCWTYTAMANAESYLLSHTSLFPNLFPLYSTNTLDLSESNLDRWGVADSSGNGWRRHSGEGGYPYISLGYFSGWNGPILQSGGTTNLGTTGVCYLSKSNPNLIKKKIMENGSVVSSFNMSNEGYSEDNVSFAITKEINKMNAHSITIVGWNDNYDRYNFNGSYLPKKSGAWLCKNSWGDYNSLGGYMYISYEDYYMLNDTFFGPNYTIDNSVNTENVDYTLYQNEKYGATYEFQYVESTENTFMNVFDFSENGNYLDKVVFETLSAGSNYKVYYVPLTSNDTPTATKSKWTLLDEGIVENAGYVCCDVPDTSLPQKKGAIAIVLSSSSKTLSDGTAANSIGVSEWLCDENNDIVFSEQGQKKKSYVIANSKITDVMDFYSTYLNDSVGGNFVIKAITKNNMLGDVYSDNRINIRDATMIQLYLVNTVELNDKQVKAADFNKDGVIDINDVTAIQLWLVGCSD